MNSYDCGRCRDKNSELRQEQSRAISSLQVKFDQWNLFFRCADHSRPSGEIGEAEGLIVDHLEKARRATAIWDIDHIYHQPKAQRSAFASEHADQPINSYRARPTLPSRKRSGVATLTPIVRASESAPPTCHLRESAQLPWGEVRSDICGGKTYRQSYPWLGCRPIAADPWTLARLIAVFDQTDMAERLRKIAQHAASARVVFLCEQTEIILQCKQALEKHARIIETLLQDVIVRQPETAGEESALAWRQTVERHQRCRSASLSRHRAQAAAGSPPACRARADRLPAESGKARSVGGWRQDGATRRIGQSLPSSGSKPLWQTSPWISSAICRQRGDALMSPAAFAIIAARSNATQAITFECVKCRRPPRASRCLHLARAISFQGARERCGACRHPAGTAACHHSRPQTPH